MTNYIKAAHLAKLHCTFQLSPQLQPITSISSAFTWMTQTPSSTIIANDSISLTCFINLDLSFDDPVTEPPVTLPPDLKTQLLSDSLIPAPHCHINCYVLKQSTCHLLYSLMPQPATVTESAAVTKTASVTQPAVNTEPTTATQSANTLSQPLLLTAMATTMTPAIGSYPPVVQLAATHVAFVPPLITHTTDRTITQPTSYQILRKPSYQTVSNTTPPVPTQMHQKISQGEFIDFAVLLHKATFFDVAIDPLTLSQQLVNRFAMWMQTWNILRNNSLIMHSYYYKAGCSMTKNRYQWSQLRKPVVSVKEKIINSQGVEFFVILQPALTRLSCLKQKRTKLDLPLLQSYQSL